MRICAIDRTTEAYLLLIFAWTLLLIGLLLVALAFEDGVANTNLGFLASGSFVIGFGVRCLLTAFAHRRPPP